MSTKFASLSSQGKLEKIEQHVGTGHPVPAEWVQWLASEFLSADEWPIAPVAAEPPFEQLDRAAKLQKLAFQCDNGLVPAPWVSWLIDECVPDQAATLRR